MTTTEEILSKLNPKLRKHVSIGSGITIEKQALPSYGLTRALGGGLPYGRQVLVWGSKSSAKSSMLLQMIGMAQKEGKVAAWIDAEMSYDEKWAEKMGVDTNNLIVSDARTINEMVDVGVDLMKAGVDIIVVDSITALLPAIYFEKDSTELKQLDKTGQIGAESKDMAHAVKMLNYANNQVKPTLLVLISQARNNITAMYTSQQPTGGFATKFYSSNIIKLFSSESENQALKAKIPVGDKLIEQVVGRKIRWELQFSKTSPAFQSGEYDFYFRGGGEGVDTIADLVDTAQMLGGIEQGGAWYTVNGERFQGRANLVNGVRENLDLQDYLLKVVNDGEA